MAISRATVATVFFVALILGAAPGPLMARSTNCTAISLQLMWEHQFQFAGYYVGIERGFYKDAGLKVTIHAPADPVDITADVVNRTKDIGIASSDLVISRSRGDPVVALAAIFQKSPLVLIARDQSRFRSMGDLIGSRIMIEPHASELIAALREAGVERSDFKAIRHSSSIEPLRKGEVDAMSAYITDEPFSLSMCNTPYRILPARHSSETFYSDVLFTSESFLRDHPKEVHAFLGATKESWKWAFEHVDETISIITSRYSSAHTAEHLKSEATAMRPRVLMPGGRIGEMSLDRWASIANVYGRLGMMSPGLSLDGFIYRSQETSRSNAIRGVIIGGLAVVVLAIFLLLSHVILRGWEKMHSLRWVSVVRASSPWRAIFGKQQGSRPRGPEKLREMLTNVIIPVIIGLAFAELVPALRIGLHIAPESSRTLLLAGTFMLVATRFLIGNQLHLLHDDVLNKAGIPWLFDLMVIIGESLVLILLAGTATIEASTRATLGFFDVLCVLYAMDVVWLVCQRIACRFARSMANTQVPIQWALLNFGLLVLTLWVSTTSYNPYSLEMIIWLFGVNLLGFVVDVILINYRGALDCLQSRGP